MPEITIEAVERPMTRRTRKLNDMISDAIRATHMAYLEKILAQYRRGLMTDDEYLHFVKLELNAMQGELVTADITVDITSNNKA
jgi:hypothetical protein